MTKIYTFLFLFLFVYSANAQNDIVIKGTVYDINTQVPLELATVYFSNVKDSTVIEYATTDKNGAFKISTKKYDKPVFIKVNYMGYQTYVEEQKGLLEAKDFGKIYLLQNTNELNEVVIKTEAPPIRMKKDTLEFNATSFKVRPDANVETLLKQLPGVEVDSDGKVKVNGKDVTQFLVNGKTFFDKDGAMILKNLPAEMISKVQVSDFKTKKEELAKQESSSENSSINFTIDKDKNKGFFGKFLGGYGSDDRYETSFVMNFFNNNQKISVLGASNNINSSGFSMDEVFDSMGGGRNNSGGNRSSGSSKGITQSNLAGINYNDQWFKGFDANASYSFSNTITNNDNSSKVLNFQPTGNFTTDSDSKTRDENTGNKMDLELEYKINPSTRIVVSPRINQSHSNSNSSSSSSSVDGNELLLNESDSKSNRDNSSLNFGNTINFNKAFEKKARNFSFVFSNNNNNSDSNAVTESFTQLYKEGVKDSKDERHQRSANENTYDSYSADLEYTEPITDSLRIRIGTDFDWANEIKDLKTFNYNTSSGLFTDLNESLTNFTTSRKNSITPKAGLTFEKNKFTFNINSSSSIIQFDNHSFYQNANIDLNKKYVLPSARAQIRYKLDRSKFVVFTYNYSNSLPSSAQLLPVENLANPLNTVIGNPDLNPNEKHNFNLSFRNFDFRTRSGYGLYLRAEYNNNEVVSTSVYDESRKRTTTYQNISGTYSTFIGGNWNQTIKKEAHVLRYGIGLNGSYSLDKGFTDGVLYDAKSLGISPRVYLNYDYGELLTIAPSYSMSYSESKYNNYVTKSRSNVVHNVNLQATSYWPKNWIFGNDLGYTYDASREKNNFYQWNTSLSYGFLNKNLIAKIKVYDVMNQNQSYSRTISATTIRDEENTILKRYAMFSLTYKIQDFAGMKKMPRPDFKGREGGPGPRGGMRDN